ncbi:MAG: T9SS type A sorting domain-containing protein [Sphingobacteriaceae bacterium]|nr:MAG: T9SS type A sorting domain-containing protein [Sphingobacteriaceae bacterium]
MDPLDNEEEDIVAVLGIDPIAACLNHIDIYNDLFPGASWLAAQNRITIQAANTISVAPNLIRTVICDFPSVPGVLGIAPSPPTSSDYVFSAGQSITFFPGFRINVPTDGAGTNNVLTAKIGSCGTFEGCGFNYSKKGHEMTHADSILASDSVRRVTTKYGGTNFYLKRQDKTQDKKQLLPIPDKITVYPNPSQGIVNVNFHNNIQGKAKITVRNLVGKTITSKSYTLNGEIQAYS